MRRLTIIYQSYKIGLSNKPKRLSNRMFSSILAVLILIKKLLYHLKPRSRAVQKMIVLP